MPTVLMLFCFSLATVSFAQPTFVEQHGQLSVKGTHIVDQYGKSVTLRGMSMYWSQWGGGSPFYNGSCIKWLRDDWKCTVVRAAMAVCCGGYLSNPAKEVSKIDSVVKASITLGIYVIIDFHETENGMTDLSQAKTFFMDMAQKYKQYPNVIYELWNEPLNTHEWATVIKPYHEALIPVIRAIDQKNIIICATRSWDQETEEASLNPLDTSKYKNIAYALHFYAATHKDTIRNKAQAALDNGIALFATEYGTTQAVGPEKMDTAETKLWYEFLDKNGIGSCNWSVCALPEACAILPENPPSGYAAGGWTESSLKPSGKFVRKYLRSVNVPTEVVVKHHDPHGEATFSTAGQKFCYGSLHNTIRNVMIINLTGRKVCSMPGTGTNALWSGLDEPGKNMPNGLFIVRIEDREKTNAFTCRSLSR